MPIALALLIFIAALPLSVVFMSSREADQPALASASQEEGKRASVLFVGDMMFDRHIRTRLEAGTQVLGGVDDVIAEADLAVGNLEGPITSTPSVSQGTQVGERANMRFTFAPEVAALLATTGFDLLSIGNNHILDFGYEGLAETLVQLQHAGLRFVGDPRSSAPTLVDAGELSVAFVAYNDFAGPRADQTKAALAQVNADVVIVLAHFGEEYVLEPPQRVRELAHSFVESGAHLVIGTHPHVVQEHEDYRGARIYYSLGNFVFDQYFSESVQCGLMVRAVFEKIGEKLHTVFEEIPVSMREDGTTTLGC